MGSRFKAILFNMLKVGAAISLLVHFFYSGYTYKEHKTRSHPKWGTIICTKAICKKELGPVFYERKQCKIVIRALSELDNQKRECIKMIKQPTRN